MMILKLFGRKLSWPNRGNIPVFLKKDRGYERKISTRAAGVQAEIRTDYLPNMNLKQYRYTNPLYQNYKEKITIYY
jgi:hypothetical protein